MPPTKKKPPPQTDKALVGIVKVPGVEEEIRNLTAVIANQKPPEPPETKPPDLTQLIDVIEDHTKAVDDNSSAIREHGASIGDHVAAMDRNTAVLARIAEALEGIIAPTPGKATRITLTSVEEEPPGS